MEFIKIFGRTCPWHVEAETKAIEYVGRITGSVVCIGGAGFAAYGLAAGDNSKILTGAGLFLLSAGMTYSWNALNKRGNFH